MVVNKMKQAVMQKGIVLKLLQWQWRSLIARHQNMTTVC
ncbi:MAG: hypothetical protein PHV54_15945 [Tolumonas sp.]|nr:hypothetical protein [Tolumonas sp.]